MSDTRDTRTPRTDSGKGGGRRGSADPVKALLHRHRGLCERAVDPLEIAAGLEAHGITDRTAARFRHRDVFSLAEELYARVPQATGHRPGHRDAAGHGHHADHGHHVDHGHHGHRADRHVDSLTGSLTDGPTDSSADSLTGPRTGSRTEGRTGGRTGSRTGGRAWGRTESRAPSRLGGGTGSRGRAARAGWAGLVLLPGALASLTLAGLEHSTGQGQLATALAGTLALSGAVSACLRRGPLRAPGRTVPAAGLWTYALLGYLLCGDGLLAALLDGGPDGPWPATATPLVTLAVAVAPAAWCARLFSVRARRGLTASRDLADFAARARPLLLGVVGLYACVLAVLTPLTNLLHAEDGALAPTVTLGTLLLLARLLTVHGFPESAATGLATACALEVLACASVLAGRIPGCDALAVPVRGLVQAAGPAAVPALACGAAALGLLVHAAVALSRASAHT
ncbi:hypothetical protein [Streptomyces sp. NPDC127033]|uniref:hypothetical protein n=1 Tax=Streptomyces sp. NPDC127033 TaxID=3347110 RepID=UPI00364B87FD